MRPWSSGYATRVRGIIVIVSTHGHAAAWIAAWNAHDLDAILALYADDVVFSAPTVVRRWNVPDGILRGKAALREHFRRGLELVPTLHFEQEEVFLSPGGYAVLYRRENGHRVIDVAELDEQDQIRVGRAYYAEEQA